MAERKTILVVEDEGVVARQLQLTLSDLGYHVPATAASAEEAFRLAEGQRPDLVLMDIHIEGEIDGIEAAATLRKRFDAAVVFLTAYADARTVERARVSEPYGYLVKPVDSTRLQSVVEVALYKQDMDRQRRLSEAKFSAIVAISADAIIAIDKDQRIALFNEGGEKIFGYSQAEIIGAPLDTLIPERFRGGHRKHVESFAASQVSARQMGERGREVFGRRKNGEEFPAAASISKFEIGGGRQLVVTLRDISEQKRVENEQRFLAEVGSVLACTLEYEDTLTSIAHLAVRNLADLCIVDIVEEDGEVRRLKVVERDPSKAWACDLLMRIPLDRKSPHLVWSVLETKRPLLLQGMPPETVASFSQSEEHLRALRAVAPKSLMAVPLLARGKLLGVITLVSSTSSRVYGPADLRLAEELAQRAALSIENARLYRAAQRAIQTRDDVLAIVAHDLRNPLNTIVLQTALLRRRKAEPERRSHNMPAEAIERAATRMNRLIEDLLDVTQMEAGHLSIRQARVTPMQVVSDSVKAQEPLAASASLELRLDVPATLPVVFADHDRLLQVFENLLGNAVKFTGPGGRITIGGAPRDGEVLFWVADTGAGIPAEHFPHLFDRFWQGRKADRAGAGLGLPIVKGIVEAHAGRVWIESTPGRGSTFFFTIPTAPRGQEWREEPAPAGLPDVR